MKGFCAVAIALLAMVCAPVLACDNGVVAGGTAFSFTQPVYAQPLVQQFAVQQVYAQPFVQRQVIVGGYRQPFVQRQRVVQRVVVPSYGRGGLSVRVGGW